MLQWTPPPHFQGWIVTLPELIQRKLMAGIPGPFRNLNFGDFVGIRVAIVVEGEGRTWAICIVLSVHVRPEVGPFSCVFLNCR
jgi:hypothetical protein